MKPGDRYVHRETGVEVEVRMIIAGEVYFAAPGKRLVYISLIPEFLEAYGPADSLQAGQHKRIRDESRP